MCPHDLERVCCFWIFQNLYQKVCIEKITSFVKKTLKNVVVFSTKSMILGISQNVIARRLL